MINIPTRLKSILVLVVFLTSFILNAQNTMDTTNESLKTKSKAELIAIGQELLKEKYPEIVLSPNDFVVSVWRNNAGTIKVFFRRSIRYITNETESMNYDVSIDLVSKEIVPFDNPELPFYTLSNTGKKTVGDLKEKGLLPKSNLLDLEYTITENTAYYLISCFDNLNQVEKGINIDEERPFLSKILVSKETGEVIRFKGNNPFYYQTQLSFKHYYKDDLYAVLKAENTSQKNNEIVKIAASILKEKQPNLKLDSNDFEIVILGNYKDLIVKYRRFIRFNKPNDTRVFDIAVNVISKEVSPFDTSETPLYTPSASDEKLLKGIEKHIPIKRNANMEYTVSENDTLVFVSSSSEKTTTKYVLNKDTNDLVWENESYTLQMNQLEDLSLQEHYKRMNGFFRIKPDNIVSLEPVALAILKENKFTPSINLKDYYVVVEASKNEIEVRCTRLVKFIPLRHNNKADLDFNLDIYLIDKTVAQDPKQFYVPTKADTQTTKFIINKLRDYLGPNEKLHYPIEIVESQNMYTISIFANYKLNKATENKQYTLNKNTQLIEDISKPLNPIYPSPATEPLPFKAVN